MTTRPVFSPLMNSIGVEEFTVSFTWYPGFAISQKQKNIAALHNAIQQMDASKIPLEVSSKSTIGIGASLSAFNLGVKKGSSIFTVESVFQASKVFSGEIGPFPELYAENPSHVRDLVRERATSPLMAFKYGSELWDLTPTRAFYDWIYCRALNANPELVENLRGYNCFTDIEFNPKKSLNCQAYAVALFLSFSAHGVLDKALSDKDSFLEYHPKDIVTISRKEETSRHGRKEKNVQEQLIFDFGFDE